MTYADALTAAQSLAGVMRSRGVSVSIELQQGVSTSGWGGRGSFVAAMSHHTVSRRSQGLTPCLSLVKVGRSDLPGPLCNGYGGFDEVYRLITMGWANHPGAGGPMTLAGLTIPANNGRPYIWGTEYEGGLDLADWTPSFRAFMGRANGAILEWLGRPVEAHIEHKTWAPTRKVDRLGYTAASGQAEILASATNPPQEDDMFDQAAEDRLNARLDVATAAANAAVAQAAEATRAATAATEAARAAITIAADTLQAVLSGTAADTEATAKIIRTLTDMQARWPRVNTARYDLVTAPTYEALAASDTADYLHLSGDLDRPTGAVAITPEDADLIGAAVAARIPTPPTSGTWSV